ncbi:Transposon Ty3-G Gag-Pol poly [Labeo rohita]|uniref:Transposon Ty3-G Gag-Pol poly n=1 Tax=Labeo rohita TaxID=84645 RepID=A0A498LIF6_LABRO|nr:Transposon Ty3-G Gag-Pol poly [Labeo rohita]
MLLRLQRYDINVVYVPGRLMHLADTLSRAYLPECAAEGSVETEIETINMLQYLPISEGILQKIQRETAKDETFQMLQQVIAQGWPEEKTQLKEELVESHGMTDCGVLRVNLILTESDCSVTERLFMILETDSSIQVPKRGDCG